METEGLSDTKVGALRQLFHVIATWYYILHLRFTLSKGILKIWSPVETCYRKHI